MGWLAGCMAWVVALGSGSEGGDLIVLIHRPRSEISEISWDLTRSHVRTHEISSALIRALIRALMGAHVSLAFRFLVKSNIRFDDDFIKWST